MGIDRQTHLEFAPPWDISQTRSQESHLSSKAPGLSVLCSISRGAFLQRLSLGSSPRTVWTLVPTSPTVFWDTCLPRFLVLWIQEARAEPEVSVSMTIGQRPIMCLPTVLNSEVT